tara:strand:- start:6932 stop:8335 length:1404 start_codon:yes stop_codon:yes gene_type:complete
MKLNKNGFIIQKKDHTMEEIRQVKEDLTVKPHVMNDFGTSNEIKFKVFLESPKKLYLPRFYGQEKFGIPQEINLNGQYINVKFKGTLRNEQLPVYNSCKKSLDDIGGAILSLKCGGGKTILALYILCQLKLKTIVVVHKEFLMTQWYDRIKEFIPGARIGKIQEKTIDTEDKDIVLGMVQSLSKKEYHEDTFEEFGLAIFDECHHLGAEVFHKCMSKIQTKYMFGLSATPNRKDGCRRVFEWYIGPIAYMTKETNTDYVKVDILKYKCDDIKYNKIENNFKGKPCCPKMITNICEYIPRINIIIDKIIEYFNEGRDILYLSDRRNNLQIIYDILKKKKIESGFYVGGMKPDGLRESQTKSIILGTFSMASEGMDIPKLNTIILGSPKSDVVQTVGRILRQKKESRKFHPLIFDINDDFSIFKNQSLKRLKYYSKQNYDIDIIIDGEKEKYIKKNKKNKPNLNICLID